MGRGFDAVNKMGKGCVMLETGELGGNWEDWGCCGVPSSMGGILSVAPCGQHQHSPQTRYCDNENGCKIGILVTCFSSSS